MFQGKELFWWCEKEIICFGDPLVGSEGKVDNVKVGAKRSAHWMPHDVRCDEEGKVECFFGEANAGLATSITDDKDNEVGVMGGTPLLYCAGYEKLIMEVMRNHKLQSKNNWLFLVVVTIQVLSENLHFCSIHTLSSLPKITRKNYLLSAFLSVNRY